MGSASAEEALKLLTGQLVRADERNLLEQVMGHESDGHIKRELQKQQLVPGGQTCLRTEKGGEQINSHLVPVCKCLVITLGYTVTVHHPLREVFP